MKTLRRALTVFLCAACFTSAALPAQAGWIEFLFPSLAPPPYDPMKTMRAPFADAPQGGGPQAPATGLPEDHIPLDAPHKDKQEAAQWLMTAAAEAMSFSAGDYDSSLARSNVYFNEAARAQFLEFLKQNKISDIAAAGQYRLQAFVEEAPLLLNQGPVEGRYRWLYEVSVMLSYLPRGASDYKTLKVVNQKYVINAQIGRVQSAEGKSGMLIESWSARAKGAGAG